MDIRSIINDIADSRLYTLHSHTEFCDGRAQMEAFAREAVSRGFTHYGFTPHSPIPVESPCNMTRAHVDDYFREFDRINAEYGHLVKFYRGMEIDYLGADWGSSNPYFQSLGLDFSIGSVHFIPSQDGEMVDIDGRYESFLRKMHDHFHDDIRYVVEKFYEHSCMMVAEGGFDIIGHLDKVGHNAAHYSEGIEDEPWYQALVADLIERVIASGVVVEINTKAFREHHRMFPAPRWWSRFLEAGVPIVINSDAHVPALINASRDEAYQMLRQIASNQSVNS